MPSSEELEWYRAMHRLAVEATEALCRLNDTLRVPEVPIPKLEPGEAVACCPECGSAEPAIPLLQLANFPTREGRLIGIITGQRVQCDDCGLIYRIGPRGPRKYKGSAPMLGQREVSREVKPDPDAEPIGQVRPEPLKRPRV